ncbi:MAG: nucleotide exchange factor GrpE [Clostridia bacterium]|nr:nucleotide exchange factor GrpE [Clostridia bacterium]
MSKENNSTNEEIIEETPSEVETEAEVEETPETSAEDKFSELEDKYMRLLAEYDNYQKRTTREKESRYGDAVIDTAAAFLPVMDDLTRALELEVSSDEAVKVKEGIELVAKKLKDVLQKLDIEEIAAVGEEFDPNLHNAIQHVEDDTVTENTVVEEYMKGYIYKGTRVVRHSMVKVAN